MNCPYCTLPVAFASGREVYPHRPDLADKKFYQCKPCNAYVGCHPGTTSPMGRLANAELRAWKIRVHAAFDPVWEARYERKHAIDPKYKRAMARGGRYKKLAELMGIPREECHIGMFDVDRCVQAIALIKAGRLEDET